MGTPPVPAGRAAELRETHSSVVVLLGERAYKVKKPVDLGFLDFRTEAARRDACHRELVLNRRIAPDVYLDVATITASDGTISEHALVMRRMPEERRLSTLVTAGADVDDDLRALARLCARFHATARRGADIAREAGPIGLRRRWDDNLRESRRFIDTVLDPAVYRDVATLAARYIDGRQALLAERAEAGLGVDGHGDLARRGRVLPARPALVCWTAWSSTPGCARSTCSTDVAFLAMDLERLGRPDLARVSWTGTRSSARHRSSPRCSITTWPTARSYARRCRASGPTRAAPQQRWTPICSPGSPCATCATAR